MRTIRLRRAQITAVRSIACADLVFPERGLILLRGVSGAGKSSLLQAISWALGASTVPASKMRRDGGDMQVDLILDIDGEESVVRRGDVASEFRAVRSAAAVKEALKTALGVPDLQALTYRAQKSRGTFLSLSDEEKKSFLVQAIPDLRRYEIAAEKALVIAGSAAAAATEAAGVLQATEHRLDDECVGEPPVTPDLVELEERITALDARRKQAGLDADERDAEVAAAEGVPLPGDPEAASIRTEIDACRAKITELVVEQQAVDAERQIHSAEKVRLERLASQARTAKQDNLREVERLQRQIDEMKAALAKAVPECHECGQPLPQPQRNAAISKLNFAETSLDTAERAQEQLDRAFENANQAFHDHGTFLEQGTDLHVDDIAAIEAHVAEREEELRDRKNPAADAYLANLKVLRTQRDESWVRHNDLQLEVVRAHHALKEAKAQAAHRQEVHQTAVARRALAVAAQKDAEAKFWVAHKKEIEARDLALALGRQGFLGAIFDEILAAVSSAVSDTLAASPNTADFTFKLVSETETKSGKAQRRIVAQVRKGALELDVRDGLSGGQGSVVDLAVDLALGEELRRRSGVDPAWLFLDEPFEGCGPRDVEALLEVLRRSAQNRLIVVVDHATETREWFDAVYSVVPGDDGATVTLL